MSLPGDIPTGLVCPVCKGPVTQDTDTDMYLRFCNCHACVRTYTIAFVKACMEQVAIGRVVNVNDDGTVWIELF